VSSLTWPGDERAGRLFSDGALIAAMVRVEAAWLAALIDAGIADPDAAVSEPVLSGFAGDDDVGGLAAASESGGNPVIPLVALLRERLGDGHATAARWLHRGLTSQDVLDTALMLCARDAVAQVRADLHVQLGTLVRLADAHRETLMVARTLTQHAVPTTFGAKAAAWGRGLADAAVDAAALAYPVQLGGAAGTLAASVELARLTGATDPVATAGRLVEHTAEALALHVRDPWHTERAPVTRLADALVRCTDAWGRIANDVLVLSRPEVAELAEPAVDGRGGSSTMPQKTNPVLSTLVRRAALSAPQLAATVHLASADAVDERPAGAWHAEWPALQTLARRAVVASSQAGELLTGLQVHPERMRATLEAALPGVLAERDALAELVGPSEDPTEDPTADPLTGYLGVADRLVDDLLTRHAAPDGGGTR